MKKGMKKGDILLFRERRFRAIWVAGKVECPLFGFSLLEVVLALAILAGALAGRSDEAGRSKRRGGHR
jgi:prepilin-type N-terminal cleavage/methylation domain-containing protein